MGWNGIVDDGLYVLIGKVLLQTVAISAEDGEDMIDVLPIGQFGRCGRSLILSHKESGSFGRWWCSDDQRPATG